MLHIRFSNPFVRVWVAALLIALLGGVGVHPAAPALAANTTFYVDCAAGNDANNGTSTTSAWKTIGRASSVTYGPGDTILLKRGCVWFGTSTAPESFVAKGDGTATAPITLADFGTGNLPKVDTFGVEAVKLENVKNWVVRNLDLTQHGQTPQALDANNEHGKDRVQGSDEFMRPVVLVRGLHSTIGVVDCGEPCTARNITLENLRVHDGAWNGIFVISGFYEVGSNRHGFVDGVTIRGVEAWNNHKSGVEFTGTYYKTKILHTKNVNVLDSYLHHNGGDGIMMGPVENGLIDGNDCSFNGQIRNARLGCWTWDSLNTTIQFNESHHNITPLAVDQTNQKARDGGGFDLDLGTDDGMMQYNWSHDNVGEGFLLLTWPIGFGFDRGVTHNADMRYNVGERDGEKLAGGITVFGGVAPSHIYNNTIYYRSSRAADSPMFNSPGGNLTSSIFGKSGTPDLRIFNNIFITDGTLNTSVPSYGASGDGAGTFTFDRNLWFRVQGGFGAKWGNTTCSSFTCWQGLGFDPNGKNVDPLINGTVGSGPAAYQLKSGSPAIGMAQTVNSLRGMGTRDYFGDLIPQSATFDTGADEFSGTFSSINSLDRAVAHVTVSPRAQVADIWTTNTSGVATSTFGKNSTVNYHVKIVDGSGTALSGVTVTSRVYNQVWDWLTTSTLSGTTGSNGVVSFSVKTTNFGGIYTIILLDVIPPSGTYYDSAFDAEYRQAFLVG